MRKMAKLAFAICGVMAALACAVPTHAASTIYLDVSITNNSDSSSVFSKTYESGVDFTVTYSNLTKTTSYTLTDDQGEIEFTLSGNTNQPGSTHLGQLLSNHVDATSNSGLARTLTVVARTDPFTLPNSPTLGVLNRITSSLSAPAITYMTTLSGGDGGTVNYGPDTPPDDIDGAQTRGFYNLGSASNYSLSNTTMINFALAEKVDGVASVQSNGTSQVTATPEPGTIVMAALGAPLLFFGYRRHRRRADSQA